MAKASEVDLLTICRGAVPQLFQFALGKVNANLKDPNTSTTKKRRLSLHFEFASYADRSGAEVVCTVETNLAGVVGVNSSIYLRKDGDDVKAFSQDVSQLDMFEETEEPETSNAR